MAAPYKLHGGNSATRSLHVWNECTNREYAKDVQEPLCAIASDGAGPVLGPTAVARRVICTARDVGLVSVPCASPGLDCSNSSTPASSAAARTARGRLQQDRAASMVPRSSGGRRVGPSMRLLAAAAVPAAG